MQPSQDTQYRALANHCPKVKIDKLKKIYDAEEIKVRVITAVGLFFTLALTSLAMTGAIDQSVYGPLTKVISLGSFDAALGVFMSVVAYRVLHTNRARNFADH